MYTDVCLATPQEHGMWQERLTSDKHGANALETVSECAGVRPFLSPSVPGVITIGWPTTGNEDTV